MLIDWLEASAQQKDRSRNNGPVSLGSGTAAGAVGKSKAEKRDQVSRNGAGSASSRTRRRNASNRATQR